MQIGCQMLQVIVKVIKVVLLLLMMMMTMATTTMVWTLSVTERQKNGEVRGE
jgi:hypothetical protein